MSLLLSKSPGPSPGTWPQPVLFCGAHPSTGQDLALFLAEFHKVSVSPFLQPAWLPLSYTLTCQRTNSSTDLLSSANSTKTHIQAAPAGVPTCLLKRCILFYTYFLFRSLFWVPSKILFPTGVRLHADMLISYLFCPKCVHSDVLSTWCFLPHAAAQ